MTYSANVFALKHPRALEVSVVVHLVSWAGQFLGHLVFERRPPAFLNDALQAFLLAPLFVFMELLFLVGYRPALYRRTRERIRTNIHTQKLSKEHRSKSE